MADARSSIKTYVSVYIGFRVWGSALNTIDHNKLLCVVHDLEFLSDATQVMADLYTNAVTKVKRLCS